MIISFNKPLVDVKVTLMTSLGRFSLSNATAIVTSSPASASSGVNVAVILTIFVTSALVFALSLLPHQLFSAVTAPPAALTAYLSSPSFVRIIESDTSRLPAPM